MPSKPQPQSLSVSDAPAVKLGKELKPGDVVSFGFDRETITVVTPYGSSNHSVCIDTDRQSECQAMAYVVDKLAKVKVFPTGGATQA